MDEKDVKWIMKNWDKIPDNFKTDIRPATYLLPPNDYRDPPTGFKIENCIVVLLVDRQRPSVISNYSFDEERLGVNRFGEVIWGFDSGCSCPSPWNDNYPNCYHIEKSWKQFKVSVPKSKKYDWEGGGYYEGFDPDYLLEADKKLLEIRKATK